MDEFMALGVRMSMPIMITAMGAIFCERSGVVNIGLEGMMLFGCFWSAWGAMVGGPLFGVLMAVLMASLLALVHAVMTVRFKVDQIISGVAINMFAAGLCRFFAYKLFGTATSSPHVDSLPKITIGALSGHSSVDAFAETSSLIIVGFLLVIATWFVLQRTVFGLRLKSVGENPLAADTLGIRVAPYRYLGVLLSGAFAGIAGAYLAVEHTGMYVEGMTQGLGYIALAAMVFGNWNPYGALAAACLFGFADAFVLTGVNSGTIPKELIRSIPYILTVLVLAGVMRRATPPAASGIPYDRENN